MALRLKLLPREGVSDSGQAREVGAGGETEVRIGRHPDNDLELPFAGISAVHARLFRQGTPSTWWLEDLGSSNGTWLGGRRLVPRSPRPVAIGDQVRLGEVVLQVDDIDASPPSAESTATLGRRLISGGSATVLAPAAAAAAAAAARPALRSTMPTGGAALASATRAGPEPPTRAPSVENLPEGRRPRSGSSPSLAPSARQPPARVALIAFAVTMTILAATGLIALALSLR